MDSRLKKAMEAEAARDTAEALKNLVPRVIRMEALMGEMMEMLRQELMPVGAGKRSDKGGF